MGAAALAALGSGRLYDRVGLRGLIVALPLAAIVPAPSFSESPALVWIGAIVWGAMGIHESTMRAAVADLVPAAVRGTAMASSRRRTGSLGLPDQRLSGRSTATPYSRLRHSPSRRN
jgi:hypothetical protein